MSPNRLNILLVEDHADTLDLLARLLRGDGHAVDPAATVREALRLAEAHPHDLLITDIGLPDGTGVGLLDELRKTDDLPAIALTGYGEQDCARLSSSAGFAAHLVKPVTYDHLVATIGQLRPRLAPAAGPDPIPSDLPIP